MKLLPISTTFLCEQSLSVIIILKSQELIGIKTLLILAKKNIHPWSHDLNWKRVPYISLKDEFTMKSYFYVTFLLSKFETYFQSFVKTCTNANHNDDSILKKNLRHRTLWS